MSSIFAHKFLESPLPDGWDIVYDTELRQGVYQCVSRDVSFIELGYLKLKDYLQVTYRLDQLRTGSDRFIEIEVLTEFDELITHRTLVPFRPARWRVATLNTSSRKDIPAKIKIWKLGDWQPDLLVSSLVFLFSEIV